MEQENITLTRLELQALLTQTAHAGAKKALTDIGLGDLEAGNDIRDLRDWLRACRIVKSEALKTAVSVVTKTVIMAMVMGIAYLISLRISQ